MLTNYNPDLAILGMYFWKQPNALLWKTAAIQFMPPGAHNHNPVRWSIHFNAGTFPQLWSVSWSILQLSHPSLTPLECYQHLVQLLWTYEDLSDASNAYIPKVQNSRLAKYQTQMFWKIKSALLFPFSSLRLIKLSQKLRTNKYCLLMWEYWGSCIFAFSLL